MCSLSGRKGSQWSAWRPPRGSTAAERVGALFDSAHSSAEAEFVAGDVRGDVRVVVVVVVVEGAGGPWAGEVV